MEYAAQRITIGLVNTFGKKYIQWALMLTGFIVDISLFYDVAFFVMIPLIFTVTATTRLPLLYVGNPVIAMLISVLVAVYTLGIARGRKLREIMVH